MGRPSQDGTEGCSFWRDLLRAAGPEEKKRPPTFRVDGQGLSDPVARRLSVTIVGARGLRAPGGDEGDADAEGELEGGGGGGDGSGVDAYCICEISGRPSVHTKTESVEGTGDLTWDHAAELEVGEDDALTFAVWDSVHFLGQAKLGSAKIAAGFDGELLLSGAGSDATSHLRVKVQVLPNRMASTPVQRHGSQSGVGTTHGRMLGRSVSAPGFGSRGVRTTSEPPASARKRHKPTDKDFGPERLYYCIRPGHHGSAMFRGGLFHHDLGEYIRPGLLHGGTHVSAKRARPKSAGARMQTTLKPVWETDETRGPEKLYFDTARYTGTARHGGPSTVETGNLSQLVVKGSLRLSQERDTRPPGGDPKRRFVKLGELGGRPYFEQVGGGLYLYCHAKEKWCISDKLGDAPQEAWAEAPSSSSASPGCSAEQPPIGLWRTNSKRAAGTVTVDAFDRVVGNLSQVTRSNLQYVPKKGISDASPLTSARTFRERPPGEAHDYEKATASWSTQTSLPRLTTPTHTVPLQKLLRPNLGKEGGTHLSTNASSVRRSPSQPHVSPDRMDPEVNQGGPTNPEFGPERLFYDTSTYTRSAREAAYREERRRRFLEGHLPRSRPDTSGGSSCGWGGAGGEDGDSADAWGGLPPVSHAAVEGPGVTSVRQGAGGAPAAATPRKMGRPTRLSEARARTLRIVVN